MGEWHRYEVEMRADGCTWWLDGSLLRTSDQCPTYPLQLFVGVVDFPERDDGTLAEHVPVLQADDIVFEPRTG